MLLVPPFLLFTTAMGPAVALFNRIAQMVLRLLGVQPRDELEDGVHLRRARRADRRVAAARACSTTHESVRLTRTLKAADATVADVLVPRDELVSLPAQPCVGDVTAAVAATGFSRFPVRSPAGESWVGYLHVKDVLDLVDTDAGTDDEAPVPPQRVRGLPEVATHGPARPRGGRPARLPRPPRPGRRPRRRHRGPGRPRRPGRGVRRHRARRNAPAGLTGPLWAGQPCRLFGLPTESSIDRLFVRVNESTTKEVGASPAFVHLTSAFRYGRRSGVNASLPTGAVPERRSRVPGRRTRVPGRRTRVRAGPGTVATCPSPRLHRHRHRRRHRPRCPSCSTGPRWRARAAAHRCAGRTLDPPPPGAAAPARGASRARLPVHLLLPPARPAGAVAPGTGGRAARCGGVPRRPRARPPVRRHRRARPGRAPRPPPHDRGVRPGPADRHRLPRRPG